MTTSKEKYKKAIKVNNTSTPTAHVKRITIPLYIPYDCTCRGVGSKWRVYMCVSGGGGGGARFIRNLDEQKRK